MDNTSNNLYLAQVQLEVGSLTEFEHRSFAEELRLCQRYYFERSSMSENGGYTGFMLYRARLDSAARDYNGILEFPTTMRATPTVTFESGMRLHLPHTAVDAATFTAYAGTPNHCSINASSTRTNTTAHLGYLDGAGGGQGARRIFVTSEL